MSLNVINKNIVSKDHIILAGGRSSTTGMTVYLSKNAGLLWQRYNLFSDYGSVNCFASDSSTILVGGYKYSTRLGAVYKTTNEGTNWINISNGLSNMSKTVNSLAIDPTSPNTYYAACDNGVFKSTDAGLNWNSINNDFRSFTSLIINPYSPKEIFTCSQNGGVLFSEDYGINWSQKNNGLSTNYLVSLEFDKKKGILYAGSGDKGLFKYKFTNEADDSKSPTKYVLSSNFPNPFKENTNIEYEIPSLTNVELTIYNLRGQRVKTLINQIHSNGIYSTNWNGLNEQRMQMANGIYYYILKTDKYVAKKKMVLVR